MVNVAVLGTGFGKYHIDLYKKNPNANLMYVFGRNREKLAGIKEKHSVTITQSIEEITNDSEVELIDICLPTELHKEYAIRALDCGKNVFCETPLAFTTKDAYDIMEAAARNGKNVFVDMFTKFSAPHRIGIDYVKAGKIGALKYLYAYNKTSKVWGDLSVEKSIFTFFINNIDMVAELLGKPEKTNAFALPLGQKSVVEANYGYNGAMATLISDSSLPDKSPFLIGFDAVGENGSIRFAASFGENAEQKLIYNDEKGNHEIEIPGTDDYEEVVNHVLKCLINKEKSRSIDIEDAIEVLEIAEKTKEIIIKY